MSTVSDTNHQQRVCREPEWSDPGNHSPGSLPVTVIERRPGWRFIDLRELWRDRGTPLLPDLCDIKVRYKQTVLGAAWAVIQPLATMLVFSLFLGRAAGDSGAVALSPLRPRGVDPLDFLLQCDRDAPARAWWGIKTW